jgi:glutamine---fructose-6-phosphate transaminase (isomerizing)
MRETIASQPSELRRMLGDASGVADAAERLRGRRLLLVGTGTSWHAANIGAWFLRAAGLDAWAVQAMDAALHGPRPTKEEGLILLSHRGTKQFTSQVLERARATGTAVAVISGRGAPGADIETVASEQSAAHTASHTGAMLRLAQLAVALGADLGPLDDVPGLVAAVVAGPPVGVEPPTRSLEFIGAGPNQWTAAEAALKVRETAYVAAAGLSVEQYLHGRMIALETAERLGTNPDSFGRDVPARAHALDDITL